MGYVEGKIRLAVKDVSKHDVNEALGCLDGSAGNGERYRYVSDQGFLIRRWQGSKKLMESKHIVLLFQRYATRDSRHGRRTRTPSPKRPSERQDIIPTCD